MRVAPGSRHTIYGSQEQAVKTLAPATGKFYYGRRLLAQVPAECHSGQINYGLARRRCIFVMQSSKAYAGRILPECLVLAQESPKTWPGGVQLSGQKLEQVLAQLTLPLRPAVRALKLSSCRRNLSAACSRRSAV